MRLLSAADSARKGLSTSSRYAPRMMAVSTRPMMCMVSVAPYTPCTCFSKILFSWFRPPMRSECVFQMAANSSLASVGSPSRLATTPSTSSRNCCTIMSTPWCVTSNWLAPASWHVAGSSERQVRSLYSSAAPSVPVKMTPDLARVKCADVSSGVAAWPYSMARYSVRSCLMRGGMAARILSCSSWSPMLPAYEISIMRDATRCTRMATKLTRLKVAMGPSILVIWLCPTTLMMMIMRPHTTKGLTNHTVRL
mmetsp:Transcript_796/g.2146  ORF Transcript_796/g.2146 Transcript_796/m.2146 type:complete len:252 (-) Transcript_796:3187-3942(-)